MIVAQRGAPAAVAEAGTDGAAAVAAAMRSLLEQVEGAVVASVLVSATVPIDRVDALDLYAAARTLGHEPWLWLQPEVDFTLLGVGTAHVFEAEGEGRFREIAAAWAELLDGATLDVPPGIRGVGPLLSGGFGFDAQPATSPVWRGFERARLVLPKLMLTQTAAGTWLTANAVVGHPGMHAEDVATGYAGSWSGLLEAAGPRATEVTADDEAVADDEADEGAEAVLRIVGFRPHEADWHATVARFAGAVGRGRIDKAVLTRQVDLLADVPVDIPAVLRRLVAAAPESTVFAVSSAQRTFLGATPERLIHLDGRTFRTVAMAGSTRRGADAAEDAALATALLESDKEREEHAVVVQMLRDTLAPLARRLDVPRDPVVLRLRHVQHLVTEVRGELDSALGMAALLEQLHPTPAVGGAPRALALELIGEEEQHERGWYAGPIGWLDRGGGGEFAVALRSGVVEGREATLFAGCGIVADSDPAREWDESLVKLRALGSALGRVES